jgi:hypothetical protein
MMNYRTVTLAVVGLFLSVSFLASSVVAAEKDGIMMQDGKMVRYHDGKEIGGMDRETTLHNGTKVTMKGMLKTKDGKEMQLQEGQMVMMDGKMKEEGDKDMKMEGMGKAPSVKTPEKDGIMMQDGKMVRFHDGREIGGMDRETTLHNGTKVTMKGMLKTKGGKEMQMQEGQMVMMDGKMKEADKDMKMEGVPK